MGETGSGVAGGGTEAAAGRMGKRAVRLAWAAAFAMLGALVATAYFRAHGERRFSSEETREWRTVAKDGEGIEMVAGAAGDGAGRSWSFASLPASSASGVRAVAFFRTDSAKKRIHDIVVLLNVRGNGGEISERAKNFAGLMEADGYAVRLSWPQRGVEIRRRGSIIMRSPGAIAGTAAARTESEGVVRVIVERRGDTIRAYAGDAERPLAVA